MKKTLLAVCLMVLGLTAQTEAKGLLDGGSTHVKVGLNMMNVSGDWAKNTSNNIGYKVDFGFNSPISNIFYWGADVNLGSRGYKNEIEISSNNRSEFTLFSHNIGLTPHIGLNFNVIPSLSIDLNVGPFISFDYYGKYKEDVTILGTTKNILDKTISDVDDYNRMDYGFNVGIGVWYNQFGIQFSYQKGFNDIIKDVDANSNNMTISLGYRF